MSTIAASGWVARTSRSSAAASPATPTTSTPVSVCCFFQAEDGIRDLTVTGVQTCALPISLELSDPVYEPTQSTHHHHRHAPVGHHHAHPAAAPTRFAHRLGPPGKCGSPVFCRAQ